MAAQPDAFSMVSPIPTSPPCRPPWLRTSLPAEDYDYDDSRSSSPTTATTHSAGWQSSDMSPGSRCSSCAGTSTSISSAPSSQMNLGLSGGKYPSTHMPGYGSESPRPDLRLEPESPLNTEEIVKALVLADGVDAKCFGSGNKEQAPERVHSPHFPAVFLSPKLMAQQAAPLSRNDCTRRGALPPLFKPGEHRLASTGTVSSTANSDEGRMRMSAAAASSLIDVPGNTESSATCTNSARACSQVPAVVNASPVSSLNFLPAPSPQLSSSSTSRSPLSTIAPPADIRPLEIRSRALTPSYTPNPSTSHPSNSPSTSRISLATIRPLPSPPVQPLAWRGRPIRPLPRPPSVSPTPTVPSSAPPTITTTPIPKIRLSPSPSLAPNAGNAVPTRVALSPPPYQTSCTPVQTPRPISTPPAPSRTHTHTPMHAAAHSRPSPLRFATVPPTAVPSLAEAPRESEKTENAIGYGGVVIIEDDDDDANVDLSPVQFAAPSSSCSSIDSGLSGPVPNQGRHTYGRVAAQANGNNGDEPGWTRDSYQRTVPRATWTPPPQDEWVCSENGRWHLSFHDRRTSTSLSSSLVAPTNPVLLQARRGGQTPGMKPKSKPYLKVKVPNLSQLKKYTL